MYDHEYMSYENEINEARALCFDVHTDCLWIVSLIETKMKKSIVLNDNLFNNNFLNDKILNKFRRQSRIYNIINIYFSYSVGIKIIHRVTL